MQKILLKRTLRDLRSNLLRYLALLLLVALCMFLVIGIVGSAQSIIETVNRRAEQNHLEDGQFGMLVPLSERDMAAIEERGVTLEPCFYVDFRMEDDSTLRLMKSREKIDLVDLYEGEPASDADQVVIERIYAAAHEIRPGDEIVIAGKTFTVSGIGTSADYDCCLQNPSDMISDGAVFGTAFVSAEAYEELADSGRSLHSEEYRYSYLLGEELSHTELKDMLLSIKIVPGEAEDVFFQEAVARKMEDRDEITDGIQKLADGADDLLDALEQFEEGTGTLQDGLETAQDALQTLDGESLKLKDASAQVLAALDTLNSNADQLSFSPDGAYQLADASAALLDGAEQLEEGMAELSEQVSVSSFEKLANGVLRQYGLDPEQLSLDAQILYETARTCADEISGYLSQSARGASKLRKGLEEFEEAVNSLPASMEALNGGIVQFQEAAAALSGVYAEIDHGVGVYTDSVHAFYEGFDAIMEGAEDLNCGAGELTENNRELRKGILELQTRTDELLDEYFPYEADSLMDFVTAQENPRIKAANDDVAINESIGILAGVIVTILITYVISVFVVHSIDRECAVIGALYALGVKRRQLVWHYTMLPVLLCLAGGALGTAAGYSRSGIQLFVGEAFAYFSVPEPGTVWNPLLLVYGILVPPTTAGIVNVLIIRRYLNRTALSLLRKEQRVPSGRKLRSGKPGYIRTFQIRQLLRERRSSFAVLAGMFVSMLVMMIGLTCYALCDNIRTDTMADIRYEYLYLYKYPSEAIPEGGYEACVKGLKKEIMGYDMEITVIGLTDENPFFPRISSNRKNEISISSATARKYGLSVGEDLILKDETDGSVYGFGIVEIVPCAAGLCAFMDIDSMRDLWGWEDDDYNAVYSDHELPVDSGRLISVSTRTDAVRSAGVLMENMMQTMVTLIGASIVIFLVVLYQMMKVMIDRSARNISLMKIFGYRDREIRKLYLDGSFVLIAAGALVILPLGKLLTDALYPYLVANVAGGIDLSWPRWMYGAVYAGVLISYLFIRIALMHRVRNLSAMEILKDRE